MDFFIKERKLNRAGPEIVALIKSLKPYRGGNIPLRAIHDLDIRDKHEALIPMASGGTSPSAKVQFTPSGGVTPIPEISSRIRKDGQHLLLTIPIPGIPLGTELPARFDLIFGFDGSPFEGHEIINALRQFTEATESALQLFVGRFDKPVASPCSQPTRPLTRARKEADRNQDNRLHQRRAPRPETRADHQPTCHAVSQYLIKMLCQRYNRHFF